MRTKAEVRSKPDIRVSIDGIDGKILDAILERQANIVEMKARKALDGDSALDENREEHVIESRRIWAIERGLNPDMVEEVWTTLLKYSVSFQSEE